jgi:hypothetical protein
VHVAEVHHLDEVAVDIARKEEHVPARRALGLADALDAFGAQVLVPPMGISDVERYMREPDAIPWRPAAAAAETRRSRAPRRRGSGSSRSCSAAPTPPRPPRRRCARGLAACPRRQPVGSQRPPSRTVRPD